MTSDIIQMIQDFTETGFTIKFKTRRHVREKKKVLANSTKNKPKESADLGNIMKVLNRL